MPQHLQDSNLEAMFAVENIPTDSALRQVLPLAPEPVANTDGTTKQDCEINAAKRMVANIRHTHPKLKIAITADGLYSKQPFIDVVKAAGMSGDNAKSMPN